MTWSTYRRRSGQECWSDERFSSLFWTVITSTSGIFFKCAKLFSTRFNIQRVYVKSARYGARVTGSVLLLLAPSKADVNLPRNFADTFFHQVTARTVLITLTDITNPKVLRFFLVSVIFRTWTTRRTTILWTALITIRILREVRLFSVCFLLDLVANKP